MKRLLIPLMLLVAAVCSAQEAVVKSPDGQMVVSVGTDNGKPFYTVTLGGKTVLERSRLGLTTNYGNFSIGLTLEKWDVEKQQLSYEMTRTKASRVNDEVSIMLASFINAKKQPMMVEFKVTNRDVAFRYHLLPFDNEGRPMSAVVLSETSSFRFPDGTTTFLSPQSAPMVGWERTKPSYEEEYQADRPMTERSAQGLGYVFPALFKVPTPPGPLTNCLHNNPDAIINMPSTWVLLSETGVNGSYVASEPSVMVRQGVAQGMGTPAVAVPLPLFSPTWGKGMV